MTEDILLEKVMEVAGENGYEKAYDYLIQEREQLPEGGSLFVHYYLMCLAAGCGKKQEALHWVKEADEKGWWYREDAVKDEDLESLKGETIFEQFLVNCAKREKEAQESSTTVCTFDQKEKAKLFLCLHGNSQNNIMSLTDWGRTVTEEWQLVALQSKRVDSAGRYRWEDNEIDWKQLTTVLQNLPVEQFEEIALGGFSAGCNMILRALTLSEITCDRILLQSPWIPFFSENKAKVVTALKQKSVKVNIACGTVDEDCSVMAKELKEELEKEGLQVKLIWQEGNAHSFPENVREHLILE